MFGASIRLGGNRVDLSVAKFRIDFEKTTAAAAAVRQLQLLHTGTHGTHISNRLRSEAKTIVKAICFFSSSFVCCSSVEQFSFLLLHLVHCVKSVRVVWVGCVRTCFSRNAFFMLCFCFFVIQLPSTIWKRLLRMWIIYGATQNWVKLPQEHSRITHGALMRSLKGSYWVKFDKAALICDVLKHLQPRVHKYFLFIFTIQTYMGFDLGPFM